MNAKLFLLSLMLFFTSVQIFSQRITKPGDNDIKALVSSQGNHETGIIYGNASAVEFYKSSEEVKEELRLELSCDANSYSDESLLIFNNSDPDEGAPKLYSMYATAPELWTVKNGLKYSISFLGGLDSTVIVPISAKAGLAGNYTIAATQLESFGTNIEISLEDRDAATFIKLGDTSSYTFEVSTAATFTNRFYLHFINKTIPPKDLTGIQDGDATQNFKIITTEGSIIINSLQHQRGKITVFDIAGRRMATSLVEPGASTRIDMHGNTGVYIVSVYTGKGKSNTKILVK